MLMIFFVNFKTDPDTNDISAITSHNCHLRDHRQFHGGCFTLFTDSQIVTAFIFTHFVAFGKSVQSKHEVLQKP